MIDQAGKNFNKHTEYLNKPMNKLHLLDILEHSIGCQVVWVRISARDIMEIFYLCSKMSEASSGKSKAGG